MSTRHFNYVILIRKKQGERAGHISRWPTLDQAVEERTRLQEALSNEQRAAGWKYTIRRVYAPTIRV